MGKPRSPSRRRRFLSPHGRRVEWAPGFGSGRGNSQPRRRHRSRDHGVPLPARHPNGTSSSTECSAHRHELAWEPAGAYRTIVELIGATTTTTGLRIRAERNDGYSETGVQGSDQDCRLAPYPPQVPRGLELHAQHRRLPNQTCGEPLVTPTGKTFSIRIAITDAPFDVDLLSMTAEEPACTRAGEVPGSDNREVLPGRRTGDVAKVPTRWRSRTLRYETARYCGIPDVPPP